MFFLTSAIYSANEFPQSIPIGEVLAPLPPKPCSKLEKCGGQSWFRTSTTPPGIPVDMVVAFTVSYARRLYNAMFALISDINSGEEQEIIEHPSSCYVIGGSSTGRIGTVILKMLAVQRTWQQYPVGQKPRQVFVTQSPVLAKKVGDYFAKLMSSLEIDADFLEEPRVTQEDAEQESDLINPDDNKQWRSELPDKYSDLLDEHFPLFITYDWVRMPLSSKHSISPSRV
jgi:hypothetical protein